MTAAPPWYETVSIPALLRHARTTYGVAMQRALEAAGYDDVPKNGLYVIGGLGAGEVPLSELIRGLRISKQSAGQLVDALVTRGYLQREADPLDRRKWVIALTERGRDAAAVQTRVRERIDAGLAARAGHADVLAMRRALAALIGMGREAEAST